MIAYDLNMDNMSVKQTDSVLASLFRGQKSRCMLCILLCVSPFLRSTIPA